MLGAVYSGCTREVNGKVRSKDVPRLMDLHRKETRMKSRSPKPFAALAEDSQFPYHMGRLVGAAEMASVLLTNQDNPDVKQIGENLGQVVNWFFEGQEAQSLKTTPAAA
jgi:hypothetical protein